MDPIATALAQLAADLSQVKGAVAVLAEAVQDNSEGLALLDKNHAVADAKAEIRAKALDDLGSAVKRMETDLTPVAVYFHEQTRASAEAAANKNNLMAYVTRERVALIVAIIAGALSWLRPDMSFSVSAPTPVQTADDAGTVDE